MHLTVPWVPLRPRSNLSSHRSDSPAPAAGRSARQRTTYGAAAFAVVAALGGTALALTGTPAGQGGASSNTAGASPEVTATKTYPVRLVVDGDPQLRRMPDVSRSAVRAEVVAEFPAAQITLTASTEGNSDTGGTGGTGGTATATATASKAAVEQIPDATGREVLAVAPLMVALVVFGFFPQPLLDVSNPYAETLLQQVGVQDDAPEVPAPATENGE